MRERKVKPTPRYLEKRMTLCLKCLNQGHWNNYKDVHYVLLGGECECDCHKT